MSANITQDTDSADGDRLRAMFDIDQSFSIDRHAMRVLPTNMIRQLRTIVMHFIAMSFDADYFCLRTRFLCRAEDRRRDSRSEHAGRGRSEKVTS